MLTHLRYIWATYEVYLVSLITAQNLVAIDAVVFIILKFQYFAHLASEFVFWGNLTPKCGAI